MYEMEKILAIVMSNKGLYPKYIKRHTIQKQRSMQGISLKMGVSSDLSEALKIPQK